MRGADHACFGIRQQHRQAIRGEHAQGHVPLRGHLAVRFDDGRLLVRFTITGLRAGHVEAERTIQHERIVHIDGPAGMHLADQRDLRAKHAGERHAVGKHMLGIVTGFAAEVEMRVVALADAAETRGVDHFDAGCQHDGDGDGNRIAVLVGGRDRVAVEDRVVVLGVAHGRFLGVPSFDYSALSVGFLVRDRMAALTGTSCGHGMEKTCAGLLMDSTQWPSASRNPPSGTV